MNTLKWPDGKRCAGRYRLAVAAQRDGYGVRKTAALFRRRCRYCRGAICRYAGLVYPNVGYTRYSRQGLTRRC